MPDARTINSLLPAEAPAQAWAERPRGAGPLISIVVTHYQGVIPEPIYRRLLSSLYNLQPPAGWPAGARSAAYEFLLYHDGPLQYEPQLPAGWVMRPTPQRENCWGHNQRDLGIRQACGEWVWQLNGDSIVYPCAGRTIAAAIASDPSVQMWSFPMNACKYGFPAVPVMEGREMKLGKIDCTQVVIRRSVWLAEGGWHRRESWADGALYEAIGAKYPWKRIECEPLLEHW